MQDGTYVINSDSEGRLDLIGHDGFAERQD